MWNRYHYPGIEKVENILKKKGETTMKVKRVILTLVILVGLLGVFAPVAGAAPAWYFVTVNTTGIGWGYTLINATDTASSPAFTNRYFVVDPNVAKQFLAVALTAISNGSVVQIYTEPAEWSAISSILIVPAQ